MSQPHDFGYLPGTWRNTNKLTKGIITFTLEAADNQLMLTLQGAAGGYFSPEMGTVEMQCFHAAPDSSKVIGFFSALQDADQELKLACNLNKGLIIIATYITVGSTSFFIREFFHKIS